MNRKNTLKLVSTAGALLTIGGIMAGPQKAEAKAPRSTFYVPSPKGISNPLFDGTPQTKIKLPYSEPTSLKSPVEQVPTGNGKPTQMSTLTKATIGLSVTGGIIAIGVITAGAVLSDGEDS